MKKLMALLLALALMLSAVPALAAEGETRLFTDSLGREVEVPAVIDRVALSGPLAQIVLFPLCPDRLVGLSSAWSEGAEEYLDTEYFNMEVIGQLYGGKGELNLETLLATGAQVVVDVGQPKDTMAEDFDALQDQTGIPFVHITAYTDTTGDAYRMLGELLGMEDEAEELAAYCERIYDRTLAIMDSVEKADLLYITGAEGLNAVARDSYHSEIIDLMANNLAVVEEPSSKGTGNEVDMEQLMNWDPDYIIFAPDSIYDTVADDPSWQTMTAIQNGNYYEVPAEPYNWLGFPPSVQRLLGMMWMAKLLYPEAADYDLYEEVKEYYALFYHCDLTREQYGALTENAFGK